MFSRRFLILGIVVFLLSLSTVISFPTFPLRFSMGPYTIDRVVGSTVWEWGTRRFNLELRQGLDIKGGVQVSYKVDLSNIADVDKKTALESVRSVMERRANFFGVSESVVQTVQVGSESRVLVELPGVENADEALALLGTTAKLEFRTKNEDPQATELYVPSGLTGAQLQRAQVDFDPTSGAPVVALRFNGEGTKQFADLTRSLVGKELAIYLDEQLLTAPTVQVPILDGNAIISGSFTVPIAKALAVQLNSGALPAPVTLLEERVLGASLGEAAVKSSIIAGLLGLGFVSLFMILYYSWLGLVAVIGLVSYALITIALYKLIPVTLTLPGIAGFLLSVGMAVDANILIFERFREERRGGMPFQPALEAAFGRAWESIRDANLNTLLVCFILFNPFNWGFLNTSGLVRGFAITLALGIFVSLFTGVVVVRTVLRACVSRGSFR